MTAELLQLLPQAFPKLSTLRLSSCYHSMGALLRALRSCPRISHLALRDPRCWDREALTAATAASRSHELLVNGTLAGHSPAALALQLNQLSSLTSLTLNMFGALETFIRLVQQGFGSRLTALSLTDHDFDDELVLENTKQLMAALQACSSLTELALELAYPGRQEPTLVACPSLPRLRSLSLPMQTVSQGLLDEILQNLPGERGLGREFHVRRR